MRKKIYQYGFGVFIIVLIIGIPIAYLTGSTKNVEGVVIGLNVHQQYEGSIPYLVVALDNRTVTTKIQHSSMYRQNAKVILIERTTSLFAIKTYTFNRYLN